MSLPKAIDVATAIVNIPPTVHLFSLDLSRAYRQLRNRPTRMAPPWTRLLFRSGRDGGVTTAHQFIMAKLGVRVWPYLDDLVLSTAVTHFNLLRRTMQELGLFDIPTMTMSIPHKPQVDIPQAITDINVLYTSNSHERTIRTL